MNYDTTAIREYAIKKHGDQRYGNRPYSYHLDMVYEESLSHGLAPIVSAASLVHDDMEDNASTHAELAILFGKELADLVECVTDEPGKNRKERKAKTYPKIRSNPFAVALKLCDRIANVRSCIEDDALALLSMYKKEHAVFEEWLKVEGEFPSLWEELDRLMQK